MADSPICKKCGGPLTPQLNKRKSWYLGCSVCKASQGDGPSTDPPAPAPEPKKKIDPPADPDPAEKKKSGGFFDGILD